jgi:sterol desaturase/sphingolipid hydroxylase (fatty acid hydroxylase superfamily)
MAAHSQISPLIGIPLTLLISCLLAEFFGYWLHRLLHSDKIPLLSRGHLIHHFLIYGPGQPMRLEKYHDATDHRFSVGNIGLEWLVPSAIILAVVWAAMRLVHLSAPYQIIALATLVVWPIFMFSYLHDRMHLSDFWMERTPLLRVWFRGARRMHDIHHHVVDDNGRMEANFGIGFFVFDRIFRTMGSRHRPFNRAGFEAARLRYGLREHDGKLVSDNGDSAGARLSLRLR